LLYNADSFAFGGVTMVLALLLIIAFSFPSAGEPYINYSLTAELLT